MSIYETKLSAFASFETTNDGNYDVFVSTAYEDEVVLKMWIARVESIERAVRVLKALPPSLISPDEWKMELVRIVDILRDRPLKVYKVMLINDGLSSVAVPRLKYELDRLYAHPCATAIDYGLYVYQYLDEARAFAHTYAKRLQAKHAIVLCHAADISYTLEGECVTNGLIPKQVIEVIEP